MTLAEMKSKIVDTLYSYSSYELPNICEAIGLEPGTSQEAYQSKKRYVSIRIQALDKAEIIDLLRKLREKCDISLIPEDSYTYQISNVTKKEIKDLFVRGFVFEDFFETKIVSVSWHGDLSEIEFIKRVTDISKIKVENHAFSSFEDEYKFHRETAHDYSQYYFFESDRLPFKTAKNEDFLKIICEIIHPEVRREDSYWAELKDKINSLINMDGYELYVAGSISGRSVFAARKITFINEDQDITYGLNKIAEIINTDYIRRQTQLLMSSLENDSTTTIGKSKELLETTFKYLLTEMGVSLTGSEDLPQLHKMVTKQLGLTIDERNEKIEGVAQVLGGLVGITTGMTSLRNKYGDGHGKGKNYKGLPPRYGKLTAGCASTYILFLLDTYEDKR